MTTTSLRDAIRSAASTPLRPETRARLAAAPGVLARAASTALESGSRDGLYEVMCQAFDVPALSPAARCWLEETLEIESFDGPLELFGVARMLLDGPRFGPAESSDPDRVYLDEICAGWQFPALPIGSAGRTAPYPWQDERFLLLVVPDDDAEGRVAPSFASPLFEVVIRDGKGDRMAKSRLDTLRELARMTLNTPRARDVRARIGRALPAARAPFALANILHVQQLLREGRIDALAVLRDALDATERFQNVDELVKPWRFLEHVMPPPADLVLAPAVLRQLERLGAQYRPRPVTARDGVSAVALSFSGHVAWPDVSFSIKDLGTSLGIEFGSISADLGGGERIHGCAEVDGGNWLIMFPADCAGEPGDPVVAWLDHETPNEGPTRAEPLSRLLARVSASTPRCVGAGTVASGS